MRNIVISGALALPLLLAAGNASADPVQDFKTADADSNGILEAPEFRHFVDLRAEDGSSMAKKVRTFRAYGIALSRVDYDGDGSVSGDELKRYDKAN